MVRGAHHVFARRGVTTGGKTFGSTITLCFRFCCRRSFSSLQTPNLESTLNLKRIAINCSRDFCEFCHDIHFHLIAAYYLFRVALP